MEAFGEALRERLRALRDERQTDTEYYRALVHVFGQLGRIVYLMEAVGEIDPALAEKAGRTLTPDVTKAVSRLRRVA